MQSVRKMVFLGPAGLLALALVASLIDLDGFLALSSALHRAILDHFYLGFSWIAVLAFLALMYLAFGPMGRVIIGARDGVAPEKLLNSWQWASITLCTTVAAGLMFWGVAEPILHHGAPVDGSAPGSDAAARFALSSLYHHWTLMPYAIYAFAGIVIALTHYQAGRKNAVSAPVMYAFGARVEGPFAAIIDSIALLAVAAGIAASLGTAVLSLSGGLERLTGIEGSAGVTFVITALIVSAFLASSISGLKRGIALLSGINAWLFIAFLLLILIAFPPSGWSQWALPAMGDFILDTPGRALGIDSVAQTPWYKDWTSFYLGVWLAWAPLAGVFLAHIARGYSVRAFVAVNFLVPMLFSGLWLSILGGAALSHDRATGGTLTDVIAQVGAEAGVYTLLEALPGGGFFVAALLAITFLSFVTAADSNTLSIVEVIAPDPTPKTALFLKMIWAGLFGGFAWIMITFAGIDGLRMMSNLGGLPALIIMLLYVPALIRLLRDLARTPSAKPLKAGPLSDAEPEGNHAGNPVDLAAVTLPKSSP